MVDKVGLVTPEAHVLMGDLFTSMLDGMWSMIKFGLSHCYGGFQDRGWVVGCVSKKGVSMSDATATLSYKADPTAKIDEVLSELGEFRMCYWEKIYLFT